MTRCIARLMDSAQAASAALTDARALVFPSKRLQRPRAPRRGHVEDSVAILVATMDTAGMPVPRMLARHCHPARGAELRPLPHHARGDPLHVRHEFRAKAHGIGCARLTCLFADFSAGAGHADHAHSDQRKAHRQCRAADKTQNTQHMLVSPRSMRAGFPDAVT